MSKNSDDSVDFGFQQIPMGEKVERVKSIFQSVASKYDVMNDLMSFGLHRWWKFYTVVSAGVQRGHRVLDLAGGTGDLTLRFSKRVGESGLVVLADINSAMLNEGRDRLFNKGVMQNVRYVQADAEELPFPDNYFDRISIAFGLRNVTDKSQALASMRRVLKPGGKLFVLEFSKPSSELLAKCYDGYSFNVIPKLGKMIAGDEDSYRYLVESIRRHPDQSSLQKMMEDVGLEDCHYENMLGGIVALHKGCKY